MNSNNHICPVLIDRRLIHNRSSSLWQMRRLDAVADVELISKFPRAMQRALRFSLRVGAAGVVSEEHVGSTVGGVLQLRLLGTALLLLLELLLVMAAVLVGCRGCWSC